MEVYVGRRGRDGWGAREGKVQGRKHSLEVVLSKNIFRPRKGEEREGAQVQIGTLKFFRLILYLF